VIRILATHKYDSAVTLGRQYIARDIQVTRVKYNQYTSCRLKVLEKWLKICRVMIKRVLIFLEGIVCKHVSVWGPSFVNLLSLSEIYTGKVVAHDLQVQIKIAIENSLLSKLSYETILSFFIHQQFYPSTVSHRSFISTHLGQICNQDELCPSYQYPLFTLVFFIPLSILSNCY
jgi:hypothetical protein